MSLALCGALLLTSCSDQPSTGPAHAGIASHSTIAVTLSDSAPAVGTTVDISIDVHQSDTTPASTIAAFRARLAFDAAALQYVDQVPNDAGVNAVNVQDDTARIAGAAPGVGFTGGRLVTLRFRVLDPQALRSVALVVDEMRDLSYKDRRADFVGHNVSVPYLRADVTPSSSSVRLYGDATADGVIDASDVLAILTKDVGLTPPVGFDAGAADVNFDGTVDAVDAQILLASLVGRDVSQFHLGDVIGSVPVTVTSVAPDTLRPGATATITGTNFSSVATNDTVMIDTVAALVTAATTTQLTITVPQTISCRATHPALVTVRIHGASGQQHQMLRVASLRSMQVGDTLILDSDTAFRCNEFNPGIYFAAVYNTAREATGFLTSFQLVSTTGADLNNTNAVGNRIPPRLTQNRSPLPLSWQSVPGGAQIRKQTMAHLQFMQRDLQRAMRAKFGPARRATNGGNNPLRRSFNLVQSIGAYSTFNFIGTDQAGNDSVVTIRARTVYVGTRSVILEDSLAPLAGQMDSYYQLLGPEFDNVMYPILTTNFGNPLAMDANLSGAGRIVMLFTPNVAKYYPGVQAFVTACDFLTPADCPATNRTEVFYSDVPTVMQTSDGSDPRYDASTPAGWYNDIRGTLIHETKHITALSEKYSRSSNPYFEESWLEEGTAQIAAELYARGVYGTAWKGGATYQQTLQCEIALCPGYSFTMFDHFAWLYEYESEANLRSPINPGSYDGTIYGSAWLLVRWAADIYASSEPAFFKALIQQVNTYGVSNLEARTGQPWTKLLGRWALALAADHYGIARTPDIPSWNTRDVFSGLNRSQRSFTAQYPLDMPIYAASSLSIADSVAAGSAAFFDLQFSGKQSIGIRATATSDLPNLTPLRLAIIRMQ